MTDQPITRTDLNDAVDRAVKVVSAQLDRVIEKVDESALVGVANQIRIDAVTLQLGKMHDKQGRLVRDIDEMKATSRAEGRVVRERDMWIVGGVLVAIGGIVHYWPVLTAASQVAK